MVDVTREDQRHLAVRPVRSRRIVGDRDVDGGAGRPLGAQGRGQPDAGDPLDRVAGRLHRAVGGVLRVADAGEAQARDGLGLAVVEHVHVLEALQIALGAVRVVVAAHPHVGRAEVRDRVEEGVLGGRAVVHGVAGVDDDVDVVLLDEGGDDLPAGRVEVDVRDVQDPHRGGVRLVRGERGRHVVELGDVGDQACQLLLVDVEFAHDAARVADHGGSAAEQAGELRLQDGLRVPGGVRGRARRGEQGEGQTARGERAAGAAVDGEAERGGARDDGDAGAHGQVERAVPDVARDLLLEPGEPLGVVHQGLRAHRVQAVHVDVQPDGGGVGAEFQGAERRDVDLRAARHGRAQRHPGVHGADRRAHAAHDQQAEPGAEQHDRDQAEGAGVGVRRADQFGDGVGAAGAVVADEGGTRPPYAVQDDRDVACHWSRMPNWRDGYAGTGRPPWPTMGACWR